MIVSSFRATLASILVASGGCAERASEAPRPSAPVSVAECGKAGQGDCPTQRWMKATLQAHLRTRDFGRLQASLTQLAERSPAGYEGWDTISRAGAKAASQGDEAGVRQSCQHCHDQHRARFRETSRKLELL